MRGGKWEVALSGLAFSTEIAMLSGALTKAREQAHQKGRNMTHSRKKTPIVGTTSADSEKADKLQAHRRERRKVREVLHVEADPEVLPHTHEVSDPWVMAKDGKIYVGDELSAKQLRK